ncbi:MAG: hypothetical protein K0S76_2074 [Herbinix sp.]|jgi:hypothetical protein|nr:hypothetical protein [Herbinix sp.]
MYLADDDKRTPSRKTTKDDDNYTNVEHGHEPEITQPTPSTTPNEFPTEMPAREIR